MQGIISLPTQQKAPRLGLVELPGLKLVDPDGSNRNMCDQYEPLLSKQVLLAHLQGGGFDAQLVNLRAGNYEEEYDTVTWRGISLSKRYVGQCIDDIDPEAYDAWGVTNNYVQFQEVAVKVIQHLLKGGKPVVVGGSDAIAEPQVYLEAGATAIVTDKSGAANWPIFDYVLGRTPREPLSGVMLADGRQFPMRKPPLSPEEWPLPSLDVVRQCLGKEFWSDEGEVPLSPVGTVFPDIGCDRKCDFCQTPTYGTGYRRMSVAKTLKWFELQKQAGARSVICHSDQFLGRVLFKEGRQEVLDILQGVRDLGLPYIWGNGLELKKATKGRGYNRHPEDLEPDEELVEAIWGWNGRVGCHDAFIPAERPVFGREAYAKLLPWQQHCEMLRAVTRTGIPRIVYGLVVGFPDDSHESMLRLEEALQDLYEDLKRINPAMTFWILTSAISPIPGTPQGDLIRQSGLLRFQDPTIWGSFGLACSDTNHMSYEDVSDWQWRLKQIGDGLWIKSVPKAG
jgi:hypothetical protein